MATNSKNVGVEIWKPVVGYVGLYEVSNLGHVRRAAGSVRCNAARECKQWVDSTGRHSVSISNDGRVRTWRVSVLVAMAFLGARPAGAVCCHNDGNTHNNTVENLRWDTVKGNAHDKYKHGTAPVGENHPSVRLSDDDVADIRKRYRRYSRNANTETLAREYGVSASQISGIVRRRKWRHLA